MSAETAGVVISDTNSISSKPTDQTSAIKTDATEALDAPSSYDTEEIMPPVTAAQVEKKSTDAHIPPLQTNAALTKQTAGARKGLPLAAALGIVALAAGSFFFFNSRGSSETQTTSQPIGAATPSATTPPSNQPPIAASDQATPQTEPTADDLKSPATKGATHESKTQQAHGVAPPATAREKSDDGTGAAQHNLNQGIAHLGAGRYQDALREFEYVKSLDPGNKSVYYLIGQTYHKMGQLERALEAYRQCTSGVYASIAQNHVRTLEKKLGKTY
jgi:tetratricopeptide (TPR) repeat protein